jgi:hypothetical protein
MGLTGENIKAQGGWYHEKKRDNLLVKTPVANLEKGTPSLKNFF